MAAPPLNGALVSSSGYALTGAGPAASPAAGLPALPGSLVTAAQANALAWGLLLAVLFLAYLYRRIL